MFQKFRELGSARQVLLWMASQNVHFPYPSNGRTSTTFEWRPIRYRNVISILKNPFYAGVYAYGKSEKRTSIVDGRARKSYGHHKPMDAWEVFIKDHHEGYMSWAEYECNQALLAGNAYGKVGDAKSGRGGRALLAGLICCARCGRRLSVVYTGRYPRPVYRCDRPNLQLGQRRCFGFGGKRIDATIAAEMLRAVAPMAIEAAEEAERMLRDEDKDRRARRRAGAAAGPVRCIVGRTSLCRLRPRQSPDRSAAGEGMGGRVAACRDVPAAARWNA